MVSKTHSCTFIFFFNDLVTLNGILHKKEQSSCIFLHVIYQIYNADSYTIKLFEVGLFWNQGY